VQGKLKRIAASGCPFQSLCDVGFGIGGTWNGDGVILFSIAPAYGGSLKRVQTAGGAPAGSGANSGQVRDPLPLRRITALDRHQAASAAFHSSDMVGTAQVGFR
jgi:hypothetical protein